VNAKAGQIRQLLQNLVSNALKFSNGQPVIDIRQVPADTVDVEDLQNKKDYVFIEVADNGIGFDEKYTNKIFGLFQRLHGSEYQGTGLGLAICKKIVDEHKGVITVKSREGKGSRFIIGLPRVKVSNPA
jgi:signal transduction histidine kinase